MNGHLLSGATFKVLDAKGETIQTGLTTNNQGEIVAEHLAPGKISLCRNQKRQQAIY